MQLLREKRGDRDKAKRLEEENFMFPNHFIAATTTEKDMSGDKFIVNML
jgi:hypothetical protein